MVVYAGLLTIGKLSNSHLDSAQFTAAHWEKNTFEALRVYFCAINGLRGRIFGPGCAVLAGHYGMHV